MTDRWHNKINFNHALDRTFKFEGLLSDNPFDRGGLTKYGITKVVWAEHGDGTCRLEEITHNQASEIYWREYWCKAGLDKLEEAGVPADILRDLFDAVVNHGVNGGGRLLQQAYNLVRLYENPRLKVDGLVGPQTIGAVSGFCKVGRHYCDSLLACLRYRRAGLYEDICERDETQCRFIRGWFRRLV
jgi:lysozyme family protein